MSKCKKEGCNNNKNVCIETVHVAIVAIFVINVNLMMGILTHFSPVSHFYTP